jgi:hypothetical protein
MGGLSGNGKLIAIGVSFDPLGVSPVQLILGRKALQRRPMKKILCAFAISAALVR